MRPVADWDETDLLGLVSNKAQESLTLDFKRSPKLNQNNDGRDGLSKMVSALANAAGGILVFGVEEDKHIATGIDLGVDPNIITKEWVDQTINSTINPRVDGVIIKQIWLTGPKPGRVAYAIEVPQAKARAPHQARDGKYYRRYNFECLPMADYEIRDAMRRGDAPELFLAFSIRDANEGGDVFFLDISIGNNSNAPSLYSQVNLMFEASLIVDKIKNFNGPDSMGFRRGAEIVGSNIWRRNLIVPSHMPIFRETRFLLVAVRITIPEKCRYIFGYGLNSPGFSVENVGMLARDTGLPWLGEFTHPLS